MPSLNPAFIAELQKYFHGEIRSNLAARILYITDASITSILPRGAGSSLAGRAIGAELIVDCSRWLDKLVDIDL